MGASIEMIIDGLKSFRGLPGRTSLRNYQGSMIIEEINPGLNVTAVKKAVNMIEDYEDPAIVLGGDYGVTCEEIDEKSLAEFLNNLSEDIPLILTGKLGKNIQGRMVRSSIYHSQVGQAVDFARWEGGKNILLIYRSNFSDISRR
jgi:UDP-N-acetylmuramyl pentapeptide synthase